MRSSPLIVMSLLVLSTFMAVVVIQPQTAKAQTPGTLWQTSPPPTAYPNGGDYSCGTSAGYVFCAYGGISSEDYSAYGKINSTGGVTSWTAAPILGGIYNGIDNHCAIYDSFIDCVNYGVLLWASVSSSGFGTWTHQTCANGNGECGYLTYNINGGCAQSGGFLTCAGGYNGGAFVYVVTFVLSVSGGFSTSSSLVSQTALPNAMSQDACVIAFSSIECMGGTFSGTQVIYASIASGTVGPSWTTGTNYPTSITRANCLPFKTEVICVGGDSTNKAAYYQTSLGGAWTATTGLTSSETWTAGGSPNYWTDGSTYIGFNEAHFSWNNFGPATPSTYTATLINADCGNCVIAGNGKYYDFRENVTSYAVSSTPGTYNRTFYSLNIQFNDSVHTINVGYNYGTGTTTLAARSDTLVSLGNTEVTTTYNSALGYYDTVVDFFVQINTNIVDVQNRDIYLSACLPVSGSVPGYCSNYIKASSVIFNILNVGGLSNTIAAGTCHHTAGGDVFADTCTYNYSPHSTIQTNSTWVNLQSYSTQFAFTSGTGNTTSAAFSMTIGFYYWDNTTWVLGPNVVIKELKGVEYSGQGGYTLWSTAYYFAHTLISNQTMSTYLETTTPVQERFYADLWYSSDNASTTWGMRVNAYYVGMSESGWWIWSSWSPTYSNQSTTQAFGSLYNHAGKLISSTQIECTKVFFTFSYTRHTTPVLTTTGFVVQQFNTATNAGPMVGVATPIYTQPLVPIIQSTSNFFAPIYAAIAFISGQFIKGLTALGNVIWSGLQAKFPWFTGLLDSFYSLIVSFVALLLFVGVYIVDALKWFLTIIGLAAFPITIVVGAYAWIVAAYGHVLGGVNIGSLLEIIVILLFSVWVLGTAESKDPIRGYIEGFRLVWGVAETIFVWTWRIASFIVNTIEGLIP